MIKQLLLILITFFLFITPASASDPMDVIKEGVDQITRLIDDPKFKDPETQEAQLEKIWNVVKDIFNFPVIARGTIRRHDWLNFSDEQRNEFTELFQQLLITTYLERLPEEYEDEKVVFQDQEMLADNRALVRTKVISRDTEIPVDYRLMLSDGTWTVYNVIVENISLVSNYRDQFSQILMRRSPEQFLEQLREKVNELEKGQG